MPFPYNLEPADRLYAKHVFVSGEEYIKRNSAAMSEDEIENCMIRGWRCVICSHTEAECIKRNPFRPYPMGTLGLHEWEQWASTNFKSETDNAEKT